jgi:hypothetical protein
MALTSNIPQVREGGFYPQALAKGLHSERPALTLTLVEIFLQGGSYRTEIACVIVWMSFLNEGYGIF